MTDKRSIFFILFLIGFTLLFIYLYQSGNNDQDVYNKKAIKESLDRYADVKKTEISEKLYAQLIEIIKTRKLCYSTQVSYVERNNICRKEYINSNLQLARQNIKSAPMLGLFIRCQRECPISGSLCRGELNRTENQCIEMEARCVEYCLDRYWRGGSYPDEDNFTYKRSKG